LRYWETEFQILRPKKSRSGQRLYTKDDIELIYEIKRLLYSDKLTIAGATKRLGSNLKRRKSGNSEVAHFPDHILELIKDVEVELRIIRNSL
jgi:DNA-binding transcriptional MerR regulator